MPGIWFQVNQVTRFSLHGVFRSSFLQKNGHCWVDWLSSTSCSILFYPVFPVPLSPHESTWWCTLHKPPGSQGGKAARGCWVGTWTCWSFHRRTQVQQVPGPATLCEKNLWTLPTLQQNCHYNNWDVVSRKKWTIKNQSRHQFTRNEKSLVPPGLAATIQLEENSRPNLPATARPENMVKRCRMRSSMEFHRFVWMVQDASRWTKMVQNASRNIPINFTLVSQEISVDFWTNGQQERSAKPLGRPLIMESDRSWRKLAFYSS